jgi:uncharacterized membrane protein
MADPRDWEREIEELRRLARELSARIDRVERALRIESSAMPKDSSSSLTVRTESPPPPPKPVSELKPPPSIPPRPPLGTTLPEADLESRIGSHWLNRIGIAAVLIGVSYFLKYAFDNNWIGPAGRVLIGLAAGIVVIIWSERFRQRGYRAFSYSLKALGIGILYLSLWAAFQVYSLIPGGVAFVAMLLVTSGTAALALIQDAQILALFALLGGFSTPLLLSTGRDRELELFLYLGLLDLATLVLVTLKPWRSVLVLAFIGTLFEYIGWYETFYDRGHFSLTLGFATLFFAIFAVAPLTARPPREHVRFRAIPHVIAFLNAGVYFLQISVMLAEIEIKDSAWVALGLAAVYIFLSRQIQPTQRETRAGEGLRLLHLAIAIGFITIAIPIRLESHWITVGWLVEAAALLWVGDRIQSGLLSGFALGALLMSVVRLVFVDNFYSPRLLFNSRMAVHALAIAVLAFVAWYGFRREERGARQIASACIIGLNLLAVIALSREVSDYYLRAITVLQPAPGQWLPGEWARTRSLQIARDFTYSALWMSYGALLIFVGFWRRSAFVRWQALLLIAVTIIKVFVYDVWQLDRGYRIVSFVILGMLLLAISFAYQRDWLKLSQA